jgi:membrane protein DedA with SNARE-associated domain
MLNPELAAVLRKRWYFVLLALGVVAFAIWFVLAQEEQDVKDLLKDYGYLVILVWTFLEGETCVILAGIWSKALGLNPWLIALSAFVGSFTIDQIMFALGKYKGESMLHYFPSMSKNVDKAAGLFKKYDVALILGFRFIYGVRNVTAILLGVSKVNHAKFFMLNFIGASVWALIFTFGGVYLGKGFVKIAERAGYGILSAVLLALVIVGVVWFVRSRRSAKGIVEATQDSENDCKGE